MYDCYKVNLTILRKSKHLKEQRFFTTEDFQKNMPVSEKNLGK